MQWFVLALISAVFLGKNSVIEKKVLFKEHASEFLTSRVLMTFIILLFFIPFVNFSIPGNLIILIYIKSVIVTFSWMLMVKTLRHSQISFVEPLKNLSPLFLAIISLILLGEHITIYQVIGILLLLVGTYVLQVDHSIHHLMVPLRLFKDKRVILLMIALLMASFSSILDKIILKQVQPFSLLFLTFFFLLINYLFIQIIKYRGVFDIVHAVKQGGYLLPIICIVTLIADISYYTAVAIPTAYVSLIIPVKRLSTLISTSIGGELFHEKGLKLKIVGCIIMLIGATIIVIGG